MCVQAQSNPVPVKRSAGVAAPRGIAPSRVRHAESDLEVTGMIARLAPGASGYVSHAQLDSLPQVRTRVVGDRNFSPDVERTMLVRGIRLQVFAEALGVEPGADLIDALCSDGYRSHFPASYISRHDPILALSINGMEPAAWAAKHHQEDPGNYFVTYVHFTPGYRILAHDEEEQGPMDIRRLGFTSSAATFEPITPPGGIAEGSPVAQGFAIARENCLRCHFMGASGGMKSGRDWRMLSTWAWEQPAYFAAYVHDPKAFEPHARMPGNPTYDAATLAALVAYFRTFTLGDAASPAAKKKGADPR